MANETIHPTAACFGAGATWGARPSGSAPAVHDARASHSASAAQGARASNSVATAAQGARAAIDASVSLLETTAPAPDGSHLSADYLIIGNSAAGVTAAETLRACDAQASILMVSDEPYPAYGRPLISYLLEGKTDGAHLGYKSEDFYASRDIKTLFGPAHKVVKLDSVAHEVTCADGCVIAYGKCLLATGSVAFVPDIKGMDGRSNVHHFMTLDDALGAWEDVAAATERAHGEGRSSRVVVVGGGLIGLKAAEALSHYADEVVVFEHNRRILPAVLDAGGASIVQRLLEPYGIVCRPGMSTDALLGEGERVTAAHLEDGSVLACDAVVIAVGVRPASALAIEAGAEQGRGLVVGTDLQTTLPDVYAAGDVTQVTDRLNGAQRPLALWPNAVEQGRVAALHMAGAVDAPAFVDSFAINAVDFYDISLLTSGIINPPEEETTLVEDFAQLVGTCADGSRTAGASANADSANVGASVNVVSDSTSASLFKAYVVEDGDTYAKFVVRDDRLVGYVLLNRPEGAGVYTAMVENEVPVSTFGPGAFDRAPQNLDFPDEVRWARLHKGYPANRQKNGWLRETADESSEPLESPVAPQASETNGALTASRDALASGTSGASAVFETLEISENSGAPEPLAVVDSPQVSATSSDGSPSSRSDSSRLSSLKEGD